MLEPLSKFKRFMPRTQQIHPQAAINLIAKKIRLWPAVLGATVCFHASMAFAWSWRLNDEINSSAVGTGNWQGTVVWVVDGDTIHVRRLTGSSKAIKVRIVGIDAPEICQQGGPESRGALQRRLMRQKVVVQGRRYDDYDRLLAQISHKNDDIGRWMVIEGQAWSYRYSAGINPYASEQRRARIEGRGLFKPDQVETPIEPRVFRRKNKGCKE